MNICESDFLIEESKPQALRIDNQKRPQPSVLRIFAIRRTQPLLDA